MATLANKVAIVTGGSGGIGSAICDHLAEEGAKVVVHYGGHADAAMSKVLSMELGDRGITVNTVSPGPTETEMFSHSGDDPKAAAARSPFNRLGQPEDIADIVAFVVSEKCRWITGHTFQAGGGYV
ncbi:SDR family oxidoreductase [Nostoc sp. CHAB 5844]|nr:SDR family oxidoreductase [Nostoc sp. CHAB 5844]